MTQTSPADTLRAAADKLRGPDGTITVTIPAATADALAQWLDSWTGIDIDDSAAMPEDLRHALAVARSILGTADVLEQQPTPAEHCTHSVRTHRAHHQQPVTGCPWCTDDATKPHSIDPGEYL